MLKYIMGLGYTLFMSLTHYPLNLWFGGKRKYAGNLDMQYQEFRKQPSHISLLYLSHFTQKIVALNTPST